MSTDDDTYKKTLGHKLEIVPVSSVMKARVGDELSLKILLDGKPLKSPVQATYDGFSRRYNTYAYATETLEDGLAYVKVNSPGIWMVRVEKKIEEMTKDYDLYSLKATLVFSCSVSQLEPLSRTRKSIRSCVTSNEPCLTLLAF